MKDNLNSNSEKENQLRKIEKLENKNNELQQKLIRNRNVSAQVLERKKKERQNYLVEKKMKIFVNFKDYNLSKFNNL